MPSYNCSNCSYETDRFSNLTKHENTKKHKEKVLQDINVAKGCAKVSPCDESIKNDNVEKFICNLCGNSYNHKSSLSNHKRSCLTKEIIIKNCEEKLKQQMHDDKIKYLEDKIKILTEDRSSYKNIAETTVETAKVSTNALSFAIKNYKNAPAIQTFNNFKLLRGNETKFSVAEIAIHYQEKKELAMYIGNILIKEYKKENPNDQSLYNTDTTRSSYIVREIINEESEWFADKGAIKTSNYTVKPILDYLKNLLVIYFEETKIVMLSNASAKLFNNLIIVREIVNSIDSGALNREIIKYISAYFHIDKKIIKQIELDDIVGD